MFSIEKAEKERLWTNWSENEKTGFEEFYLPKSIEELQQIIIDCKRSGNKVRVVGAGHSFSPVAKPDDVLISLHNMRGLYSVDTEKREATLWAGTYLHEIGPLLKGHGLALENMGDIQEQSIAGAVSTGTHGTGITLGSIADQVIQWEWIDGNGNYHIHRRTSDEDPLANSLQVTLGLLGVLVRVTLQAVPLYGLRVTTKRSTLEEGLAHWEKELHQYRHLEWFWFPNTSMIQVKTMEKIPPVPQPKLHKMTAKISQNLVENYAFYLISEYCRKRPEKTEWASRFAAKNIPNRIVEGYAYEMYATPRKVKFYETELAIPIENFKEAMDDLIHGMAEQSFQVHFPIEIRFVKGEEGYLSPNQPRNSAYLAFHMYQGMPYENYFMWIWKTLEKYDARFHWGKMSPLNKEKIARLYPNLTDFLQIRERYDPDNLFITKYFRDLFL